MSPEGTANDKRTAVKGRHGKRVLVILAVILACIVIGSVVARKVGERYLMERLRKVARTRLGMDLTIEKLSIGMGGRVTLRGIRLTTNGGREAASCSRIAMRWRSRLGSPVITRVRMEGASVDVSCFKGLIENPESWVLALRTASFDADLTGALRFAPRNERGVVARTVKGRIDCEATLDPGDVPADYPAVLEVMEALGQIGLAPSMVTLRLERGEGSWLGKGTAHCESLSIPLSVRADAPGSFRVIAHLPAPWMDIMNADYDEIADLGQLLEVEGIIAEDLSAESSVSVVPSVDLSELFAPFEEEE